MYWTNVAKIGRSGFGRFAPSCSPIRMFQTSCRSGSFHTACFAGMTEVGNLRLLRHMRSPCPAGGRDSQRDDGRRTAVLALLEGRLRRELDPAAKGRKDER